MNDAKIPPYGDMPRQSKKIIGINPKITAELSNGKDATGLCTVREATEMMMNSGYSRVELFFMLNGKKINVELSILRPKRQSWFIRFFFGWIK